MPSKQDLSCMPREAVVPLRITGTFRSLAQYFSYCGSQIRNQVLRFRTYRLDRWVCEQFDRCRVETGAEPFSSGHALILESFFVKLLFEPIQALYKVPLETLFELGIPFLDFLAIQVFLHLKKRQ